MNLIKSPSSLVAWKIYTGPVGKLPCQGLENLCVRPVSVIDLLHGQLLSLGSCFSRYMHTCIIYAYKIYTHINININF